MTTRFSPLIRRYKMVVLAILPVAGLLGMAIATTPAGSRVIAQGSDAVAEFMGRSPGERGSIDDIKGRRKHALGSSTNAGDPFANKKPTERALGKIFDLPLDPGATVPAGLNPAAVPQGLSDRALSLGPLQNLANIPGLNGGPLPINPPSGGSSGGIPGSGGVPGVGGGPGAGGNPVPPNSGGPGIVPPVVVPGVTGAVPEPATWLLMVVGFGLAGLGLRRRAPANQTAASRIR